MLPVFLLQNNYFEKLHRLVGPCLDYCRATGADFVDRSLTDDFDPDVLGLDRWPGVMVYGSVGWMKRCAESSIAGWVYYDRDTFAASDWVPAFGDHALNGGGRVAPVSELRDLLARGARVHVRPDREDKAFVGAVHDIGSWDAMEAFRNEERRLPLSPDEPCWISPLREIAAEHRCWFVGGELVSASTYRRDGAQCVERVEDTGLLAAARDLAAIRLPADTVVMDVAETDGGLKVVEFNPIHSSGWYDCDTFSVLGAWSEMTAALSKERHRAALPSMRS